MYYAWIYIISQLTILLFSLWACIKMFIMRDATTGSKLVSLVVFVMIIWVMFRRDTYLPFLGYAAYPMSLIPNEHVPVGATKEALLPIEAPDGTRVIYWGAKPADEVQSNPITAYGDYSNAGVATIKNKEVVLRFACPAEYKVGYGKRLRRHIHYRLCCDRVGLIGPVETAWVTC
jgi:hypothetical protein